MEERCSFYPEIASESNQINEAPTKSPAVLEEGAPQSQSQLKPVFYERKKLQINYHIGQDQGVLVC